MTNKKNETEQATCCCSDPGCKHCGDRYQPGGNGECGEPATRWLWRVDMDDPRNPDAMPFCEGCADDAMDSGVFGEIE